MALVQSVLSICLEKYGLDIIAHPLMYAPECRLAGTTFDVEYAMAHRLEVRAIPVSEILHTYLLLNALEADRAQQYC